ncbi:MAG TPA: hypothetical protein VGG42_09495, partial [Acidobacteriaceae bacterium]
MTLSWSLRLVCLLLVVFALLLAILQLALVRCAPFILRRLESASARRRESILYRIQLAPFLAAFVLTTAACIPAYVRFEPSGETESVSALCLLFAFAAVLWIASSLLRGLRIALRTLHFTSACRRSGQLLEHRGGTPVLVVPPTTHPVALLGFRQPLIIVSADLLTRSRLPHGALAVALDHERSHVLHRDNWKLLSVSFLPRLSPLVCDPWTPAWRSAADWAADDDAVRSDTNRSLLLAEAIVQSARAARLSGSPAPVIHSALTSAEAGLVARIDRLVHPRPVVAQPPSSLTSLAALILLAAIAAIAAA